MNLPRSRDGYYTEGRAAAVSAGYYSSSPALR